MHNYIGFKEGVFQEVITKKVRLYLVTLIEFISGRASAIV